MATSMEPYDKWLEDKLLSLNPEIDTDVFVMYIKGILDEDSPEDEKKESILELLGEVLECDKELVCEDIVKKWTELSSLDTNRNASSETTVELATQFADLLQNQNIESVKTQQKTDEEKARKAAILAHYANVSDEEEVTGPGDSGGSKPKGGTVAAGPTGGGSDPLDLLSKNTNALSVTLMEKEKREKSKEEAEKKREKDKVDRQAQKQKQQDRKEAEKKRTQKGERKTR